MQESKNDFSCESVLDLDGCIRFVGIFSKNCLIDSACKNEINLLVTECELEQIRKNLIQIFTLFQQPIGYIDNPQYLLISHENIKLFSLVLDKELFLLASFERSFQESKIIHKIMDYLRSNHFFDF